MSLTGKLDILYTNSLNACKTIQGVLATCKVSPVCDRLKTARASEPKPLVED